MKFHRGYFNLKIPKRASLKIAEKEIQTLMLKLDKTHEEF